jgi:phosphoribosylformylglycinamidine synthase
LAESYRKVALSGAKPIAVTNCLNFGSPEDEAVMWQFERSVTGLADATQFLNIPVTGGNVSFYNQTGKTPIIPTPVIGVLGVIEDVTKRISNKPEKEGLTIYLIGETKAELDGSACAWFIHNHLGGTPPKLDLETEQNLCKLILEANSQSLIKNSYAINEGGSLVALAKIVLNSNMGIQAELDSNLEFLFSESASRALVLTNQENLFENVLKNYNLNYSKIGVTTKEQNLDILDQFKLSKKELLNNFQDQYPKHLND